MFIDKQPERGGNDTHTLNSASKAPTDPREEVLL